MGNSNNSQKPPISKQEIKNNVPELVFKNKEKNKTISYKVIEELGSGGFGKVYKVVELSTNNIYALKLIRNLDNNAFIKATKEASILKDIKHENIVKYYSCFPLHEGSMNALCIVMEFIEGMSLQSLLEKISTPFPFDWIIQFFVELLNVMDYLGDNLIAHRDIKPANIMIILNKNSTRMLKLVDFGLAGKSNSKSKTLENIGGTIAYLPPEILINGKATVATRDIWAIGLVLYQVITLDSNFISNPLGWLGYSVTNPNILSEKLHDVALEKILSLMLEKDPTKRLSAKQLLAHDIVLGFKIATSKNPKLIKNIKVITKDFVAPFISVIRDGTSVIILRECLEFIKTLCKQTTGRDILLNLNIVYKLCDFMKNSTIGDIPKALMEELTKIIETPKKLSNAEIKKIFTDMIHSSIINILVSIISFSTSNFTAISQIYSSGSVLFFLEKFKKQPATISPLLSLLCIFKNSREYLLKKGLGYIIDTHFLFRNSNTRDAMFIYERLAYQDNDDIFNLYIDHLLERPPFRARSRLYTLICSRIHSHKLINNNTLEQWSKILTHCHIDMESMDYSSWINILLRLIFNIDKTIIQHTNNRLCIRGFFPNIEIFHPLYYCDDCSTYFCIACADRCHDKKHKSAIRWGQLNTCGCNNCSALGQETIPVFKLDTNIKLLDYPILYRNSTSLQIKSKGRYTIPKNKNSNYGAFYIFQDKAFVISDKQLKHQQETILYYFEVAVHNTPKCCNPYCAAVAIGLSSTEYDNIKTDHCLGWHSGEFGYHSDDGKFFHNAGTGTPYGIPYCAGDIIGCGITSKRKLFYTYNGSFIGCTNSNIEVNVKYFTSFSCVGTGFDIEFYYSNFLFNKFINTNISLKINNQALSLFRKEKIMGNLLLNASNSKALQSYAMLFTTITWNQEKENQWFFLNTYSNISNTPVPKYFSLYLQNSLYSINSNDKIKEHFNENSPNIELESISKEINNEDTSSINVQEFFSSPEMKPILEQLAILASKKSGSPLNSKRNSSE